MYAKHEWVICPKCRRQFLKGAEQAWKGGICFHCRDPLVRTNNMMFHTNPLKGQPHGWIQWKGSEICMDVTLPCCDGHIDGEFMYFIKCLCGKYWAVDGHIRLLELTAEEGATLYNNPSVHELQEDKFNETN